MPDSPTEQGSPDELGHVRDRIDAIDEQLVSLLVERETWVRQVAELKTDASQVAAPERAARVIGSAADRAAALGGDPSVVRAVYTAMIQANIELETTQMEEQERST